jgi:phage shock protein PspC (stress-responsive transcriptional regulator)
MLLGVCGGLARYFDLHPALYRVAFVVLTLLGGSGILIYAAAALVIPDEGKEESFAAEVLRERRDRPWALIGLGLVAVGMLILLSHAALWPNGDGVWIVLVIVGGVILWRERRGGGRRSSLLRLVFALLLAVAVFIAASTAVVFATIGIHLGDGVGEHVYHVASTDDLRSKYRLGVGHLELDLSKLELPAGETTVNVRLGVGRLQVIAPAGALVRYSAKADAGDIDVFGSERSGWRVDTTGGDHPSTGEPVLVVEAHVGAGKFELDRAVR